MDAVSDYLRATCGLRPPTAEEERALFEAGKRDELILRNTRLVASIAKRYRGLGVPFRDLIQEGIIGLIEAVDRFDVGRGLRFSTYAASWIRRSIVNCVKGERLIRIPRNMVDDLGKIERARQELTQQFGRSPTLEEVAIEVGLEVTYIENLKRADHITSLDAEPKGGDPILAFLGDDGVEERALTVTIIERIDDLEGDERIPVILSEYYLRGRTYNDIANQLPITSERVRQLAELGLEQMREELGIS